MTKKIVLVGCGNIGSRHLQALTKLEECCKIQVVEPKSSSVEIGKQRINTVGRAKSKKMDVEWLTDINKVVKNADLTIIATLATGRVDILSKLISMEHRRFLIEKIVCQSADEYERLLCLMNEYRVKGWVNCTRRYTDFYKTAASILHQNDGPVILNVRAGNRGLGCNAIHFLDLFNWFIGNDKGVKLDGRYVLSELFANSRGEDLVEFAGTIIGKTQNNDFLTISFLPDDDVDVSVNISRKNVRVWVNETAKKALIAVRKSNWDFCEYPFRAPYTSEITKDIAEDIFSTDSCHLPKVEELFVSHKELFGVFNSVIEMVTNKKAEFCTIT